MQTRVHFLHIYGFQISTENTAGISYSDSESSCEPSKFPSVAFCFTNRTCLPSSSADFYDPPLSDQGCRKFAAWGQNSRSSSLKNFLASLQTFKLLSPTASMSSWEWVCWLAIHSRYSEHTCVEKRERKKLGVNRRGFGIKPRGNPDYLITRL